MKSEVNPDVSFYRKPWWMGILGIFFLILAGSLDATAQQCKPDKSVFHHGEQISYDIYFKWGLLMPRAGSATFTMKNTMFEKKNSWNYNLTFRTHGVIEKVYKMRDTIDCYFSPDLKVLYSSKRANEKNYYQVENISFSHRGNYVTTHTHRYNLERTRLDTTITTPGCVYDMVGASMYLRSIDWNKIKIGDEFPFKVAIGKDIVNVSFRYTGQQIVERDETLKYRTRHFVIDIFDDAFEQSKAAAEVWVGDDQNRIPVKVRAKLKIGAAEVYYNNSSNLQYPFTSRVVIPRR